MRYQLTLCFETPFSVGIGNEALFHTTTQRVIPGATLRGALAALWWRRFDSAADFAALFDDDLLVTQAVPEGAGLRTTSEVTCKYRATTECGEVVYDRALFVASGDAPDVGVCPRCEGPLTATPGGSTCPTRCGAVAFSSALTKPPRTGGSTPATTSQRARATSPKSRPVPTSPGSTTPPSESVRAGPRTGAAPSPPSRRWRRNR